MPCLESLAQSPSYSLLPVVIRVPHDTTPVRVFVIPVSWLGLELRLGLELELELEFKLGLGLGLELGFKD